ncbi:hypothetical protein [Paracoccus sp. PAR01]|uniref:hypothetical protein n=1 Tax=Paracoccus sp. PAR01 TaxID=2769282 RepID=UPI001786418F|nr:hypothetical protein [Paracoccus sp. PAR01]MBD9526956.1 hypothetical protein [Paracoccus sp. PAR01]
MRGHPLISLLLAGLLGCAPVAQIADPGVAELSELQTLAAAGDRQAIADHTPTCRIAQPGCPQVHEMTADACLALAQQAMAARQTAEAARRAACAESRYRDLSGTSVQLRGLEALRLQRETARSPEAAGFNRQLQARAGAVADPAAGYYWASAVDWRRQFGSDKPSCAELVEAQSRANAAATAASAPADQRGAARSLAVRLAAPAQGCSR